MIQVKRVKEPVILNKNKDKWLSGYLASIANHKLTPTKKSKNEVAIKENKYRHIEIKNSLKGMFADKCAYCESYIGHVSYGHIEHFKPKVKYPKQCFNWNNLLLGCEICNGAQYKGTQFPQKKDRGPLINPSREDPFNYLTFDYDPATGTANVLGRNVRGNTTETVLGLNRPALLRHRNRIVRRMAILAINASKGDAVALAEMKNHIQSDEEYSAFAITLFKKFGLK